MTTLNQPRTTERRDGACSPAPDCRGALCAPYDLLARLFEYPNESYAQRCREAGLDEFASEMEKLSPSQIQEQFVATFDWNPATALDLGWHLYGEQYARGEFLVRVRKELRKHGIQESSELPDHLTHILPLLARMDSADAVQFVREFVAPAVAKLVAALDRKQTPFALLMRAVREALPVQVEIPPPKVELPVLPGVD
ncbi:MAG TPA: nitrate reductase molybdenum cofactor assembly chaperone [Bryobacteraceae bacterium]|nr:nitrate reductase molybdenum cofactor assembly chaperone [Bryobacteraceae bacterium]